MTDENDEIPSMEIGEFPQPESKPTALPKRLDKVLADLEDDETDGLDHLPAPVASSLQLLADCANGREFVSSGPTGKQIRIRPDLDQRLRASTTLLKLIGGDVTGQDVFAALGISRKTEEVSVRQLARAIASDVIEFRKALMAELPHGIDDRAAIADRLCAVSMSRYCAWRGSPIEATLSELLAEKSTG